MDGDEFRGEGLDPPAGKRTAEPAAGARTVPSPGDGRPTCCEILPRLETLPRATPRPAELRRISDLPCTAPNVPTGIPRLTTKVCPGAAGGRGGLKRCGAFTIRSPVFQPVHVLPGCQNQP